MPYIHFGRIGDIWKHLPLAEFLEIEKPKKYIESNSASSVYLLSCSPEQQYGIYHFMNNSHKSDALMKSAYHRILKSLNPGEIKRYPGSSVLSMHLLKSSDCRFFFYDIEKESIDDIQAYSARLGIQERCKFFNEDSFHGIMNQLDLFDEETFIHFDPYDAFLEKTNGFTYLDLFFEANKRGIKAMLWYGFMTRNDQKAIHKMIKEKSKKHDKGKLFGIEVFLRCIQKDTVFFNPGILGSGILTCHLSKKTEEKAWRLADELKGIYMGSSVFDKHKGDLDAEKMEY